MKIYEVVGRDGFQNEPEFVSTEDKIRLIDLLGETGVDKIEATAFVSPKAIPNLRDATEIMEKIKRNPDVIYTALVPNLKGAEHAILSGVDEVNVVISVSETHNLKNIRMTREQSFENIKAISSLLKQYQIGINISLSTSFGCPFEGRMEEDEVISIIERLHDLGIDRITLADTTGMATPDHVYRLASTVFEKWPALSITLHFHNTRGMGLANVLEGIRAGVTSFDSSLGGIGGCPFAPGATGNICTEDLVHMLHFMGYEMRANLDQLIHCAKELQKILGRDVPGQIIKAGKITDLHPV